MPGDPNHGHLRTRDFAQAIVKPRFIGPIPVHQHSGKLIRCRRIESEPLV